MNCHFPQSDIARAEVKVIAQTDLQYIVIDEGGGLGVRGSGVAQTEGETRSRESVDVGLAYCLTIERGGEGYCGVFFWF